MATFTEHMSGDGGGGGSLSESEAAVVTLQHDWDSTASVSAKILAGVAAVTNTPPTELDPPLYEQIDPDALETVFQFTTGHAQCDREGVLTLPLYECTVTLSGDGTISIQPPDEL